MKKNMAFGRAGNISIVAHTNLNPSSAEWDAMLEDMKSLRATLRGVLVYSEGGSPNAIQRRGLRDVLLVGRQAPPRSVVLTTSTLARIAVTAINLFFDNTIKALEPSSYEEGLAYLGVTREEWPALLSALKDLAQSLGLNPNFSGKTQ